MKNLLKQKLTSCFLAIAALVAVSSDRASAQTNIILTDNFTVDANSNDPNFEITNGRQGGVRASSSYTAFGGLFDESPGNAQHQVGNTTTDVGQPGGTANSNYLLLLQGGANNNVDIANPSNSIGPVTISFDLYATTGDGGTWGAFSLRALASQPSPLASSGEFGFLKQVNGALQVFQNGGITPSGWNNAGFATDPHWVLLFSDAAGTGSAFNGHGSKVTMINGTTTLGTINLAQLNSSDLRPGFICYGNGTLVGVDNLSISAVAATPPPVAGPNLDFEYDVAASVGSAVQFVPTSWTAFNQASSGDIGSQNGNNSTYSVNNPLAAPASSNQFCYINMFNPSVTGGIYQDLGGLKTNSIYTLTVAIGSRKDRVNSPGIISLINGTNNTGTLLASGGGLPSSQDFWQDFTTTFTTGPSVSGDLTVVLSVLGNATTIQADFDNVRLGIQSLTFQPPFLVQNISPTSSTVIVGSNAVFTAAFSNSPPVTLQWQYISGGVTNNINTGVVNVTNSGIVTSTLTLSNAQVTQNGSYRLVANNAGGVPVYTTAATLTVVPPITWYPAGTYNGGFSNNTVLTYAGTTANEVYGVDFGAGDETTANGYIFHDYAASGNVTIAGSGLTVVGTYLPGSISTGDFALDLMLGNGVNGSSANTATLNNLTVGQTYTVLVLLADDRTSGAGGPTFHVTDGVNSSPSQQYAFPNGTPEIGGFIIGTFTAHSTNQPLTVLEGNGSSQYNAILLESGTTSAPPLPATLTSDINPLVRRVTIGSTVTLSVAGQGALPLVYQWFNQSGAISGATNASYSFSALNGTNSYYATITNSYGGVTSSSAQVISSPTIVTVKNFSFEVDSAGSPGGVVTTTPTGWTSFNEAGAADIGSQWANGTDYTVINPLAPPADQNQFCYINMFNSSVTGGIYQDVGALKPFTTYTLTVAIGSRADRINSPGIISLINGTNNTGAVLATGGGLPSTQNTWQNYTATYSTGASVTGDLVVELSVLGNGTSIQADFDNVQLNASQSFHFGPVVVSGGNLILTATGGTPGGHYTLLATTNLTAPVTWTTNTAGTFSGTGSFSNSVPINTSQKAAFFELRAP